MAPNGGVMSVTITLAPVLQVAPARQLFVVADRAVNDVYDVSPDGQRFLVNTATERVPPPLRSSSIGRRRCAGRNQRFHPAVQFRTTLNGACDPASCDDG